MGACSHKGWEEPVNTLEDRAATQRDLNTPEERANRRLMKRSKDKCKALITGRKKPWQHHRLGIYGLESSSIERTWDSRYRARQVWARSAL